MIEFTTRDPPALHAAKRRNPVGNLASGAGLLVSPLEWAAHPACL